MAKREWILKRNCSISPRQLGFAFTVLCLVSLLIAMFFTWRGAWYVLGFAVIELSAVAWAFLVYARHVNDHERIALIDEYLWIELVRMEQIRQFKLRARAIRVGLPVGHGLIRLEANGALVEVGRFLTDRRRREFALELQRALASARME